MYVYANVHISVRACVQEEYANVYVYVFQIYEMFGNMLTCKYHD